MVVFIFLFFDLQTVSLTWFEMWVMKEWAVVLRKCDFDFLRVWTEENKRNVKGRFTKALFFILWINLALPDLFLVHLPVFLPLNFFFLHLVLSHICCSTSLLLSIHLPFFLWFILDISSLSWFVPHLVFWFFKNNLGFLLIGVICVLAGGLFYFRSPRPILVTDLFHKYLSSCIYSLHGKGFFVFWPA